MKPMTLAIVAGAMVIFSAGLVSADNGAAQFSLDGGSRGAIDFPHKMHQEVLANDCQSCHDVFPKELGVIKQMKQDKQLKRKQVMNRTCLKCHKDLKKAGEPYGPISCNDCHQR